VEFRRQIEPEHNWENFQIVPI
jgi:hypothetical protein